MPLQFISPALQGASFIGRVGVPLMQQLGISAGLAGLGAAAAAISNKPASSSQGARRGAAISNTPKTGREKLNDAWGLIPESAYQQGFSYRKGNGRPYSQPLIRTRKEMFTMP